MTQLHWLEHIKVIGWDLDGTLYPDHPDMKQKIIELRTRAVAQKLAVDEKQAEIRFNQLKKGLGSNTLTLEKIGIKGKDFFAQMWDDMDLSLYIRPNPCIKELFESLSGYTHFLLSNANRLDQIQRKLDLIGVPSTVFQVIIDTVELGIYKPNPEVYLRALAQLNQQHRQQFKPEQVLFVGDRFETDMKGAKAAGMRTCLVGQRSRKVDVSISQIYELVSLLKVT